MKAYVSNRNRKPAAVGSTNTRMQTDDETMLTVAGRRVRNS